MISFEVQDSISFRVTSGICRLHYTYNSRTTCISIHLSCGLISIGVRRCTQGKFTTQIWQKMQCNAIYIICYTCIVPVYNCTSLSVWNISYLKLFIEYESRKLQSPPNAVSTGHKTVGICGYLNGDFSYVINTFKKDKGG